MTARKSGSFSALLLFLGGEMLLQQTTPSHSVWFDIVKEDRWRWFSRTQVALKSTVQPQVVWEDGGQNDSMLDLAVQETIHLHCYIWMCDLQSIFSSDFLARCDHKATAPFGKEALARILGSAGWRERGVWVWLGSVLQQLIKDARQVFQD